jgi:two-component system, LytTR family, response regulator LytT
MKILIVEDESIAADRLEKIILELMPEAEICGKTVSIKDSVKWLMENKTDLIFLDIQLSDGISFSIFEQINTQTPVIFTTAYDQYAIKAFELNSISYLLKPIRKEALAESLHKYKSLKSAFSIDFEGLISAIHSKQTEYRKRFLIQAGDKFRKVEAEEIAYLYALEGNVFLKTFEGNSYPVDSSLENLENTLDPDLFFRINRKYLVHLKSIVSMHAWSRSRIKIQLKPKADNEDETIVSIDRSGEFKRWLNR